MTHTLDELLAGMADRDPDVRDGWAYSELSAGLLEGRFADDHDRIRTRMLEHLRDGEIQARAFAPLVFTWLVLAGDRNRADFDMVANWYVTEADTRGYDPERGWLHAVAHGADYLGEATKAGIAQPAEVLEVAAARMIADGPIWAHQEDARLGVAIMLALSRVDAADATDWMAPIEHALDAFEAAPTLPPPAWLRNVSMTLADLYLALSEQPMDGSDPVSVDPQVAEAVRARAVAIFSRPQEWFVQPRG